jgi:ApaG protein
MEQHPAPIPNAPAALGSDATTRGIRVQTHPVYMNQQADPDGMKHVFGYRVVITNQSDQQVQVLGRCWVIIDSDGDRRDIEGEGIVGQQPILEPGESFEYASFCPLPTEWGTMEGSYLLASESGEFRAAIGRFYLIADEA